MPLPSSCFPSGSLPGESPNLWTWHSGPTIFETSPYLIPKGLFCPGRPTSSSAFGTTFIFNTTLSPMLFPPFNRASSPLPLTKSCPGVLMQKAIPLAPCSCYCRFSPWTVGPFMVYFTHWSQLMWLQVTEIQLDLAQAKRFTARLLRNLIYQEKVGRSRTAEP